VKTAFGDTFFWLATLHPGDHWHQEVLDRSSQLGPMHIVTTDEVLVAVLAGLSGLGERMRSAGVALVRELHEDPDVTVVPQTRTSSMAGLELYSRRLDKSYSLSDCISMQMMWARGISEVLTNDRHFSQEGFVDLFRD